MQGNQDSYLSCRAVWQMLVSSSWLITDQAAGWWRIVSGYFSFHSSGHPTAARTGVRVIPPICHCVTSHQTQYTLQLLCCYIFAFSPFVKNVGWEGHDSGHMYMCQKPNLPVLGGRLVVKMHPENYTLTDMTLQRRYFNLRDINKFALLWGEAQLCLPYVCWPLVK